jgi:cytochrome c oxidase subunit II
MRTTLCLIFAFALTACGGSDPAPAPAPEQPAAEKPAPEAAPEAAPGAAADAAPAAAAAGGGDAEAGKAVYNTYCLACHQADGTGMGGALAADFVGDKARLAKSDAELLASIENGIAGTTMIAWGGQLDETKRKDVLAYIRATFGK